MDPNLCMILDEIQQSKEEFGCRFDDHDAKWERRFADFDRDRLARETAVDTRLASLESPCGELQSLRLEHLHAERDNRVAALEAAATDLGSWLGWRASSMISVSR